jgi:UDP-glucose 4-epimerase
MELQRIFITGGAGFIGSHTVDLLLKLGKQVVVLDNLSSGKVSNLDLVHPNLEFIEGDVLEYPLVEELVADADAVLHLAAIASVPYSIEHPIYSFQVNTQGFLHVLQAAHRAATKPRIVYASSAAVYGNAKVLPCSDSGELKEKALSPYALQKMNDEEYADLYRRLFGVNSLALRYFNVYGERQDPASPYSGVISRFIAAVSEGKEITVFGDGQQSRDFIHVSDVAAANVLALQSDYQGALNIATGKAETLLNIISYLKKDGQEVKVTFLEARTGDILSSYADVTSAKKHLEFQAKISLREGIQKLIMAS